MTLLDDKKVSDRLFMLQYDEFVERLSDLADGNLPKGAVPLLTEDYSVGVIADWLSLFRPELNKLKALRNEVAHGVSIDIQEMAQHREIVLELVEELAQRVDRNALRALCGSVRSSVSEQ